MARPLPPAPPSHWTAALILLIWHGLLGADYALTRFDIAGAPALMAQLPLEALWLKSAWAAGVWLGLLGALFLALRDNASVLLLFLGGASFVAVAAGLALSAPPVLLLPLPLPALLALLVLVPLAGWVHARRLNQRGLLR